MKYRRSSINFFFAQILPSQSRGKTLLLVSVSEGARCNGLGYSTLKERQSILPFELAGICEEVVEKMYFHGDSISIAGFPKATLFCMRRSLGEMELHRICQRASVCIHDSYRIQFALERKEGYACNARSFGPRKKVFPAGWFRSLSGFAIVFLSLTFRATSFIF